jgi:hypothetical protein
VGVGGKEAAGNLQQPRRQPTNINNIISEPHQEPCAETMPMNMLLRDDLVSQKSDSIVGAEDKMERWKLQ